MNQWKIGDVKITRVIESEAVWEGTQLLPNATPENVKKEGDWLAPFSNEEGKVKLTIQALIIESQGKRILVDTCIGNDKVRANPEWNKLKLPFLSDLEKAGSPREKIDRVICTHLHIDHVGWNTMLNQRGAKAVPVEKAAADFHLTFIIGDDQPRYSTAGAHLRTAGQACGYRFRILKFEADAKRSRITVTNIGVAPLYHDAFLTVNGVRGRGSLKGLLPGEKRVDEIEAGGRGADLDDHQRSSRARPAPSNSKRIWENSSRARPRMTV